MIVVWHPLTLATTWPTSAQICTAIRPTTETIANTGRHVLGRLATGICVHLLPAGLHPSTLAALDSLSDLDVVR